MTDEILRTSCLSFKLRDEDTETYVPIDVEVTSAPEGRMLLRIDRRLFSVSHAHEKALHSLLHEAYLSRRF